MTHHRFPRVAAAALAVVVLAAWPAPGRSSPSRSAAPPVDACLDGPSRSPSPVPAGAPLRFGVTAAGPVFADPTVPEDPARTVAAMDELRESAEAFVARINLVSYDEGRRSIARAVRTAKRYARAGFLVSVELRYNPASAPGADGFSAWVGDAAQALGRIEAVSAVQVTHEVDVQGGPAHSDGSFPESREALVDGVIAARAALDAAGSSAGVGFTYNPDLPGDQSGDEEFWTFVAETGEDFKSAVDWVGISFFPERAASPERAAVEITAALAGARCWMSHAGFAPDVPLHVTQNAYFSPDAGPDEAQDAALEQMLRAVHTHRKTFNVTDYLWFTLRDHDSAQPEAPTRQGLMTTDYEAKPAFGTYRGLIEELGG